MDSMTLVCVSSSFIKLFLKIQNKKNKKMLANYLLVPVVLGCPLMAVHLVGCNQVGVEGVFSLHDRRNFTLYIPQCIRQYHRATRNQGCDCASY
jgi:hypothetical protein